MLNDCIELSPLDRPDSVRTAFFIEDFDSTVWSTSCTDDFSSGVILDDFGTVSMGVFYIHEVHQAQEPTMSQFSVSPADGLGGLLVMSFLLVFLGAMLYVRWPKLCARAA